VLTGVAGERRRSACRLKGGLVPDDIIFNRGFSALLFDMDGTLLDSTAVVERIWGRWAIDHGIEPGPLIRTIHGIRAVDVLKRLNLTGVDPVDEARRIEAQEMEDVEGIVPVAGAIPLLNSLPPKQWAIVTSAPIELARKRLAAAGIPMPEVIVSGEDVARGKPHPDCYLLGAKRLGFEPGACLAFEDAPAGTRAAEAAGCPVVLVTATHSTLHPLGHIAVRDYLGLRCSRDDGKISVWFKTN